MAEPIDREISVPIVEPAAPHCHPFDAEIEAERAGWHELLASFGTDTGAALNFDPAELTVEAGADVRVTFENRASVPHNLTFQAPINVLTEAVVAPGTSETVELTAPTPGEYAFVCTLHPGMGGKLIVEAGRS